MTDLRDQVADPSTPLSARRHQILTLLADGLTSAEIAEKLWITEHTVKTSLKRLFKLTGTTGRAGLVAYAYRVGWLTGAAPSTPGPAEPAGGDRRRVQRVRVALRQWADLRNTGSLAATGAGLHRAVLAALDLPEEP